MLRTLIFGGIVAYVGKTLYDNGTLTRFGHDLSRRLRPNKGSAGIGQPSATVQPPATGTAPAFRRATDPVAPQTVAPQPFG